MKVLKKCGWFIICILPVLLYFAMEMAVMSAFIFVYTFSHYGDGTTQAELAMQANEWVYGNTVYLMLACQVMALLVFGIWYYVVYGKKKRSKYVEKPEGRHVAVIVVLGILLQVVVNGILNAISVIAPEALTEYEQLMENSGITETSVVVLFAIAVMAPIVEELLCRGVIFRLARHVSAKFWVANTIQALLFGVLHANLVQGLYAFVFGLVLGYVYGKYERIWLCMLLHGVINLSSMVVGMLYGAMLLMGNLIALTFMIAIIAAATAGIVVCLKEGLGPISKVPEAAVISASEEGE